MLTLRVWAGLGLLMAACAVIGFIVAPRSNAGLPDQASVLSLAAMAAVGIERLLELIWATLGSSLGGWWPLKPVVQAFSTVETQTNALLGPILTDTQNELQKAKVEVGKVNGDTSQIDAALAQITDGQTEFQKQLEAAQSLAPGSERLALLAKVAASANGALSSAVTTTGAISAEVQRRLSEAQQAIDVALTVAQSFSDNPARRIASILIGGSLGMLAAALLGLNIFSAVLGTQAGYLYAGLGVILTGFVIGLGSSPTHEVVKALQNYKEARGITVQADISPTSGSSAGSLTVTRGLAARDVDPQSTGSERIMLRGA
jgi:hypothetical protein